jgi:hypothetical protein
MKLKTFTLLTPLVIASSMQAQTVRSWTGATGSAWHTATNWSPSGTFAGEAAATVTGEGAATDVMTVAAANTASNFGINMNTMTAGAGGLGLTLGGIDYNKTQTTSTQIGNSSTTVNGLLQLNGATIDGVKNALEFVLGGEPNPSVSHANSVSLLPQSSLNQDGDLVFVFPRKIASIDALSLSFQWSSDLAFPTTQSLTIGPTSSTADGITVAMSGIDSATQSITITVSAEKAVDGRLFGRLHASVP